MTIYTYKTKCSAKLHRFDFILEGRRFTERGFPTRRAALDAESAKRREIARGLTDPYPTMAALVEKFLAHGAGRKTDDWNGQCKLKLAKGFGHLDHLHPREVTRAHLENALDRIRASGKNGPRSVNEFRKIIKAVFHFAVQREALDRNPAAGIEKLPEPDTQIDPVPKAHLSQLILAADVRLRALLLFLSQTGARFVEAARLTKADLHLDGAEPFALLRTRKRRGGHESVRPQPLTRLALDAIALTAALSDRWVFPDATGAAMDYDAELKRLRRLSDKLDLPHYSFHRVRHWAGTVATQMGQSKKAVALFLGHADTHATERYMHAIDAEKWAVARRLEAELESEITGTSESAPACG